MNRPDCWEILGINPTRNIDRIRTAFRKKAKLYHPDSPDRYAKSKGKFNFIDIKDGLVTSYGFIILIYLINLPSDYGSFINFIVYFLCSLYLLHLSLIHI